MTDVRSTEVVGIFQGDVIIRTAIEAAIADLRARPDELDYIWASLAQDELTRDHAGYGENQIQLAKQWFLNTDIPVFSNVRVPDNIRQGTFVTIAIQKSDEVYNTLGDSHWAGYEKVDGGQPFFSRPFTVRDFDWTTGYVTLPDDVAYQAPLSSGVVLFTRNGRSFPITEVVSSKVVKIDNQQLRIDLRDLRLRWPPQKYLMPLEGEVSRELYGVGCHSYHEPIHALYLYAAIRYALMRYRERYLEARGFQASSISAGQLDIDSQFDSEMGYSRYLQLTGIIHQVWNKDIQSSILAVTNRIRVIGGARVPVDVDTQSLDDLLWIGDLDGLGVSFGAAPTPTPAAAGAVPGVFFGAATQITGESEVRALAFRATGIRQTSFTTVVDPGYYIWFVVPVAYGEAIFEVGKVVGGFILANPNLVMDGVSYRVYRSAQAGLGTTNVEVL
jgi:hypothetical protein